MALHDDKSIGGNPTIGVPARRLDQLFTRILEVIAATTILLCLTPILLISSIAIRTRFWRTCFHPRDATRLQESTSSDF